MPHLTILVVEAGGTTLRAGLFDAASCTVTRRCSADTPNIYTVDDGVDVREHVFAAIGRLARQVTSKEPDVVAVAFPGPMDPEGTVLAAPTVAGASGGGPFSLARACAALWPGTVIHTLNDLTAAGLRLVGDGMRDFAIVAVGSGIGHKVFLDSRPCLGSSGRGGEIGHLRLDFSPKAPLCDCGGYGHLGALASGRGTVAMARRLAASDEEGWRTSMLARLVPDPPAIDAPALATAYLAEDPFATRVITAAVRYLGQALAAIHLDTGVERIVLVGGFGRALGERYRAQAAVAAAEASWDVGQDWNDIVRLGPPDDDSALLGAGMWAAGAVKARVGG